MKNLLKLIGITGMVTVIGLFTTGCKTLDTTGLAVPENVKIEIDSTGVQDRERMVVTWNEVPNASGYEIHSVSVGCGSGNRLINTKNNSAFGLTFDSADTQRTGKFTVGDNSVLHGSKNNSGATVDKASNGAVEIIAPNKIAITLMPEWNVPGDNTSGAKPNTIMASSLRVKVKALGGKVNGLEYSDSGYSGETTLDTSAL